MWQTQHRIFVCDGADEDISEINELNEVKNMELPYRGSGKVYYADKEYQCDLYYNEKEGGIILKINVKNKNAIGSFLEVPLKMPYLCGQLDSGFKFTLLYLRRINTEDMISYSTTVFTFDAAYILCGIGESGQSEQTFYKVHYTLSDIIEWGEESAYCIGENHEIKSKKEDVKKQIYSSEKFSINYLVYGSFLPCIDRELLTEKIELKQHGVIEINFEKEQIFIRFNEIFEKLKWLLEISTRRRINVEAVTVYSHEIFDNYGDKNIERNITVYGEDIKENRMKTASRNRRWKWINLGELIKQNSFENYFLKHDKLAPIIELFLEPFYVEKSSETRVFLNLVQALETYHSRFVTNDIDEFKQRVDNLLSSLGETRANEYKTYLLAHSNRFITLESRLADLLIAEWKIHFDTGDIKYQDFPSIIAHSRNYYIHYDEGIKEKHRVLSQEELQTYNTVLIEILEYYILLELGFVETNGEIKKKITERWGNVSQSLEISKISKAQHGSQS